MGSKIYGQGFLFDDLDSDASPLRVMEEITQHHMPSRSRVFPYIGGEEINGEPQQRHHRYVINFSDIETEDELAIWPALAAIVRAKVKPERDALGDNPNNVPLRRRWWAYQAHRPELYSLMGKRTRVLVNSQVSPHLSFAFQPTDRIFSHALNVLVMDRSSEFATVQCRVHEVWGRFLGSSMKDDLRYTPSTCLVTFPFPEHFGTDPRLEGPGKAYYEFRAALMVRNNEGLTKTYNRFHAPTETSPDIARLRELHSAMDRAVLDAYGWTDIPTDCQFLLDYEDDEDEDDDGFSLGSAAASRKGRGRKKPWRYRWPDEIRDEVLARLLALNAQRAEQERLAGLAAGSLTKTKAAGGKRRKTAHSGGEELGLF
jgi:hypothetical protein